MRQHYKKKMMFLITVILVLSLTSSKVIAEEDKHSDTQREISSWMEPGFILDRDTLNEYKEDEEVPDIYGTKPETTFTFEVNGQILQPGESIYIETAPDQQPIIRVGK
ncbi:MULTISPECIES: hypothetical protein [Paenibacillus]|uniref:hypothetical protein n=1 Tax=Paenibacillus TaxID=44249 RepID=UPI00123AE99F|nr:hypothetical protein [Paenibacillus sp. UASWS1643]KAA8750008.1 hypothetical protein FE296_18070 [Paenibacillus sp. UASWS1643]